MICVTVDKIELFFDVEFLPMEKVRMLLTIESPLRQFTLTFRNLFVFIERQLGI